MDALTEARNDGGRRARRAVYEILNRYRNELYVAGRHDASKAVFEIKARVIAAHRRSNKLPGGLGRK